MNAPRCSHCPDRPPLKLSQPCQDDYVRILAVCPECGRWYLRLAPPGRRATVAPLPVPTLDQLGVELEPPPELEPAAVAGSIGRPPSFAPAMGIPSPN